MSDPNSSPVQTIAKITSRTFVYAKPEDTTPCGFIDCMTEAGRRGPSEYWAYEGMGSFEVLSGFEDGFYVDAFLTLREALASLRASVRARSA